MKKKYLPLIALLCSVNFSYAQSPIYTTAGYGASYSTDGAYVGWNISGGGGETNFVNNIGLGGIGGFTFDNTTRINATTRLMTILANGNVGIGTPNPGTTLHIQNAATNYASTITLKNTFNGIASRAGLTMENDAGNQTMFYKQASGNADANDVILYSAQGDTRVYTGGIERFRISNSGRVGIGTASPAAGLDVWNGATHVAGGNGANYSVDGAYLGWNISGGGGETNFVNNIGLGWMGGFTFDNTTRGNVVTRLMTILGSGNVGIGTTTPDAKLAVNGAIHAKQINVDLNVLAPDYVFEKNYKLRSLPEISRYITFNKHLPEIPSAKSLAQNGINVSELNMKLLQKVEELTLYTIAQDKQATRQQKQVDQLQAELVKEQKVNQSLQEQINSLARQIRHR